MSGKVNARQKRPLVSGLIYLGLGIYLLMVFNEVIPSVEDSWPIILIIIGAALIGRGLTKSKPQPV
jgi:hypothetical protein